MRKEEIRNQASVFWRVFRQWAGIMALPGAFALFQQVPAVLKSGDYLPFLVVLFYWAIAPGVVFGAIGAVPMIFLVHPGQRLSAILVGLVIGGGPPIAFFAALAIFLPKNEGTLGWALFAMIFGMTGAFAGILAGYERARTA